MLLALVRSECAHGLSSYALRRFQILDATGKLGESSFGFSVNIITLGVCEVGPVGGGDVPGSCPVRWGGGAEVGLAD